jgi:hypothetical protein
MRAKNGEEGKGVVAAIATGYNMIATGGIA